MLTHIKLENQQIFLSITLHFLCFAHIFYRYLKIIHLTLLFENDTTCSPTIKEILFTGGLDSVKEQVNVTFESSTTEISPSRRTLVGTEKH